MDELSLISFDGDGTLWDFESAMAQALDDSAIFLTAAGLADVSGAWLREVRNEVAARPEHRLSSMEDIRIAAFEEALARRGSADADLLGDVYARYMQVRFARIELYPDVVDVLTGLRALGYRLALITNGNTYPDRIGLDGVFDAVVMAGDCGVAKPDPKIYTLTLDRVGVSPRMAVHVGDGQANDVRAAEAAGLRAVWLNRLGVRWKLDDQPVETVTTLHELSMIR